MHESYYSDYHAISSRMLVWFPWRYSLTRASNAVQSLLVSGHTCSNVSILLALIIFFWSKSWGAFGFLWFIYELAPDDAPGCLLGLMGMVFISLWSACVRLEVHYPSARTCLALGLWMRSLCAGLSPVSTMCTNMRGAEGSENC